MNFMGIQAPNFCESSHTHLSSFFPPSPRKSWIADKHLKIMAKERKNTSKCYFVHYPSSVLSSSPPDNSSNDGRGKKRNILYVNTRAAWRIQWGPIITELKMSTNSLQPQVNSIHELRMGNIELY